MAGDIADPPSSSISPESQELPPSYAPTGLQLSHQRLLCGIF